MGRTSATVEPNPGMAEKCSAALCASARHICRRDAESFGFSSAETTPLLDQNRVRKLAFVALGGFIPDAWLLTLCALLR